MKNVCSPFLIFLIYNFSIFLSFPTIEFFFKKKHFSISGSKRNLLFSFFCRTTLHRTAGPAQKFALFSLSRREFRSFFCLWESLRGIVAAGQGHGSPKCAFGLSGVIQWQEKKKPKFWAPTLRVTIPQAPTLWAPYFFTVLIFPFQKHFSFSFSCEGKSIFVFCVFFDVFIILFFF